MHAFNPELKNTAGNSQYAYHSWCVYGVWYIEVHVYNLTLTGKVPCDTQNSNQAPSMHLVWDIEA